MPDKPIKKEPEKEDYEVIPHQILEDLRDEVELLKESLSKPQDEVGRELLASMAEVRNTIHDFMEAIKAALKEIKTEEKVDVGAVLKNMNRKMDELSQQNEEIASALVSIAEMVKRSARPAPQPMPMPARPMPPKPGPTPYPGPMPPGLKAPPSPLPPPPSPMPPGPRGEMPPPGMPFGPSQGPRIEGMPPPGMPKKKGLIGTLFKK